MDQTRSPLSGFFPISRRDLIITVGIFCCAVGLCIPLRMASNGEAFASPIFVLAVLLISRLTNGYLYGLIASVLSVIGVNYIFTYPYMAIDFTLSGYPLSFFTFLMVSCITSALTTKIKKQEQIRVESEKEKMRANLLRSVSHDIRTPLTSIMGASSTILDSPSLSPSEQRALLEDIRDEAQWLIRAVENLLSITRIGNDGAQITKTPELAEEILGAVVRKFRKRSPSVSIVVEVPKDPLFVPMDPILIEQVLYNLLENAVTHGETTTEIRLSVEERGGFANFFVRDNGKGIPPQEIPALFDGTLKRNETSRGDGKRNMGLGLSVCLAIVRSHGGTMQARNLAQGAEFSFTLPLLRKELTV